MVNEYRMSRDIADILKSVCEALEVVRWYFQWCEMIERYHERLCEAEPRVASACEQPHYIRIRDDEVLV